MTAYSRRDSQRSIKSHASASQKTIAKSHASAGRRRTAKSHAAYLARKVIPCPYPGCDTKHSCRYNLNGHIREKHTKERPYICDVPGCSADFNRPWLLTRHKKKKHPGMSTDQVHVLQEDLDANANANANENDGNDNGYPPYSQSEGMPPWPPAFLPLMNCIYTGDTDHITVPGPYNEVKALLSVVTEGFSELDTNTWTRLTAVPPPSSPAIYVCMDCNFDHVHLTAGDLQAHYHVAHNIPHQDNCSCHMRSALPVEQGPWLVASSGGNNSAIDPRLL